MSPKALLDELMRLSAAERIQLAQDLWDSVADSSDAWELTDAQRDELDRRLAGCERSPEAGASWDEVKRRVQGSP